MPGCTSTKQLGQILVPGHEIVKIELGVKSEVLPSETMSNECTTPNST